MRLVAVILQSAAALAAPGSLESAVQQYDEAQIRGDRAALERLLADDYLLTNSGGDVESKSQFIADLTDPNYHLEPYSVQRPVERTWRDGAIRGGVVRLKGTSGGKTFDACLRFVDVWRRQENGWRVAYSQAARIPSEGCAR